MPSKLPEIPGAEHRFVDVRGVRLHVAEAGTGDDVVVLLHGFPQHWWCWRKVLPYLVDRHRVLMPDLRGFGWSDTPGEGYDPEAFADDVIGMLDELGVDRAAVVGHDWGGATAFVLGLRYPERISRMVPINTIPPWPGEPNVRTMLSLWRVWYTIVLAFPGTSRLAQRRIPWFLALGGRRDLFSPEESEVYAQQLRDPDRQRAGMLLYRCYQRLFWQGLLGRHAYVSGRLTVPALFLFGREDYYVPASWLEGVEAHCDELRVEFIDGTGHFSPEERPEIVGPRIAEFLA